jgi:hypothetical protein
MNQISKISSGQNRMLYTQKRIEPAVGVLFFFYFNLTK